MARIRTIKPEFYLDEELAELSIYARFIFPGLWQHADSEGRLEDRHRVLKLAILPWDDQDFNALLDELANAGFILRYEVGGNRYIHIKQFLKNQRLSGKEATTPSTHPNPPCEATVKQQGSVGETQESQERKGKEGKEEKEGNLLLGKPNAELSTTDWVVSRVIDFLNAKAGRKFTVAGGGSKHLRALARACRGDENKLHDLETNCFLVIEYKLAEWGSDPSMAQYLRPETLFAPTHWESYTQSADAWDDAGRPTPYRNGKSGPRSATYDEMMGRMLGNG